MNTHRLIQGDSAAFAVPGSVAAVGRALDPLRAARAAARRLRRRLRRHVEIWRLLRAGNGPAAAAEFMALSALGLRRSRRLRVSGEVLSLRTASPDVIVARDTLTREFEPLRDLVDVDYDGLVVDAGGYIGTAALRLARLFPKARIVTLEPCRENFTALLENVRGVANITPVNAALAAEGAARRLTLFDRGGGEVGFTLVSRPRDTARPAAMYAVDTITPDTLMRRFGAREIGFLKMDVEGAERDLLARSAWLNRVGVLMIELHERIAEGCERAFQDATAGRVNRRFGGEKHVSFRTARWNFAVAAE